MPGQIDYEQVLRDLEARRGRFNQAIDSAIAGIKTVLSLTQNSGALQGGQLEPAKLHATGSVSASLSPISPYSGLSLGEAGKALLKTDPSKGRTNHEIAGSLEQAGYPHGSTNFANVVGTAMWREVKKGDVKRVGNRWYLSGHEPSQADLISDSNADQF